MKHTIAYILIAIASCSAALKAESRDEIREDIQEKERTLKTLQDRIDKQLDPTSRHDLENMRRVKKKRLQKLYDKLHVTR